LVLHRRTSLLGGSEINLVPQLTLSFLKSVALSI
jgi:hypothetical protein